MKLDFLYVINLNTDEKDVISKLQKINFPYNINYYILNAANGWEIEQGKTEPPFAYKKADWWPIDNTSESWIEGNSNNKFFSRPVTPGEVGCFLSHYQCVYNSYRDGFNNVLILEEDFKWNESFPSQDEFMAIPDDASIIYLGRSAQLPHLEKNVNKHIVEVNYSYNTHAYIITRKGMEEVLNSKGLDNIIAYDEFLPALNGTTERLDAKKLFHNPNFKAYAFNRDYFNQTSNFHTNSLTEYTPEQVNQTMGKTGTGENIGEFPQSEPVTTPKSDIKILDDSNWDAWCKRYINPLILNKEYDLAIDEPCPHVYTFPFFTKAFCKEIIRLSEQFDWTTDRHEFYPTTDNLLEVLGMDKIYNRVINEHVRPLAINRFQLEGRSWDHLRDESFIIKYPYNQQAHLSLHHDHSNITTLVNLNPGEFEGGGTYFPKFKCNVNPKELGVMTLHPGNITHKHGARPVTQGTRYVVVSFIKGKDHL